MIIVGGSYLELCKYPHWDRLFGSGLRAAVALSAVSHNSVLHSYAATAWIDDIRATLSGMNVTCDLRETEEGYGFEYLHPFQLTSRLEPTKPVDSYEPIIVEGENILRFGMVEAMAQTKSRYLVYDPQNEPMAKVGPELQADFLTIVLKAADLLDPQKNERATGAAIQEKVLELFDRRQSRSLVVVVRDRLGGSSVFLGDEPEKIPPYAAESYFRIGSGDVYAAAFAHAWAEKGASPVEAAHYAGRCLAYFVEGARLPIPTPEDLPTAAVTGKLVNEIRILPAENCELGALAFHTETFLKSLGAQPTLELFELADAPGPYETLPAFIVIGACRDWAQIAALARRTDQSMQRVVYWPNPDSALAARYFPNARIVSDYATALYLCRRGLLA